MKLPNIHDIVQKTSKGCTGAIGQVIHVDQGRVLCLTRHPTNQQAGFEFFSLPHGEYEIVGRSKIAFDKALDAFNAKNRTTLTPKPPTPPPDEPTAAVPAPAPEPPPPEPTAVVHEPVAAPPKRRGRPPKESGIVFPRNDA